MSVGSECDGRPWSRLTKSTSVSDGVVLIDPEYLKERKGEAQSGVQTLRQVAGPTWCLSCPSSLCHPDLRLPLWSRRFGCSRPDVPERPVHGQQPDVPVTTRPGEESDPPPGTLDEEAGRTCSPIHLRGSEPVAGGQANQRRLTGSLISPGTSSGKSRTWIVLTIKGLWWSFADLQCSTDPLLRVFLDSS